MYGETVCVTLAVVIFFLLSEVVILQYDRSRFITENPQCDPPLMSSKDDWDFLFLFFAFVDDF